MPKSKRKPLRADNETFVDAASCLEPIFYSLMAKHTGQGDNRPKIAAFSHALGHLAGNLAVAFSASPEHMRHVFAGVIEDVKKAADVVVTSAEARAEADDEEADFEDTH